MARDEQIAARILADLREDVQLQKEQERTQEEAARDTHRIVGGASVEPTISAYAEELESLEGFGFSEWGTSEFGIIDDEDEVIEDSWLVETSRNTLTDDFIHYLAKASLDPDADEAELPPRPNRLAVGRGDDFFHSGMDDLNEKIGRVPLTASTISGDTDEVWLTAQITTDQFNGEDIREMGIMSSADDRLFNIARITPPIEKHDRLRLTVQVEWEFSGE